jgi:hypothetical protein
MKVCGTQFLALAVSHSQFSLLFSISANAIVVKLPFVFVHVVAVKEPLESSDDDAVHVGAMQRKSTGSTAVGIY